MVCTDYRILFIKLKYHGVIHTQQFLYIMQIKERKNLKLRDARAKSKISVIICDLQYLFSGCFKSSFDKSLCKNLLLQ